MQSRVFEALLASTRKAAAAAAAPHAAEVDTLARFPDEAVAAIRELKLFSAAVPETYGGYGCSLLQQAQLCGAIAQACSASGMILAMHLIEVGCIARHGASSAFFRNVMERIVAEQILIASVTSEKGTSGDTRSSICAVERVGERFTLEKIAPTISYGQHADALLVTARRAPDAAPGDQVLIYLEQGDYTLAQTSDWDTLGMRGTCSAGGKLQAEAPVERIVPGTFADASAQTMLPYSHILWSAVWWGIAVEAVARAAAHVRAAARRNPGITPPAAGTLALATADLQTLNQQWRQCASEFDGLGENRDALMTMSWMLRMVNQKIAASQATPQIVHQALQIIGVEGYRNDSNFSVGRLYRDSLSAALMISNERLVSMSASMLLVLKEA